MVTLNKLTVVVRIGGTTLNLLVGPVQFRCTSPSWEAGGACAAYARL